MQYRYIDYTIHLSIYPSNENSLYVLSKRKVKGRRELILLNSYWQTCLVVVLYFHATHLGCIPRQRAPGPSFPPSYYYVVSYTSRSLILSPIAFSMSKLSQVFNFVWKRTLTTCKHNPRNCKYCFKRLYDQRKLSQASSAISGLHCYAY